MTALLTRISPVRLKEPGPTAAQLEQMLQAAAHAPDHGRLRPWRFFIVQGDARAGLGEILAQRLLSRSPDSSPARLDAERKKALRAPVIIVIAAEYRENTPISEIDQLVGVGAAVQNFLIAAHALGFGAFWRTGDTACDPHVKTALGLRITDAIVGILYVGDIEVPGKPRSVEYADRCVRWGAQSSTQGEF